ncbi:MAG: NAD(P)H-dependent oxidoreductase [Oscillospiraceae bacterium]|nr:NAD(P)H-dependent oxidoreductase [Oscillospiraceae bacterium]
MKILIVNGSPRGRFSVTLQSCLYLEKRFPRHSFEYLNVGAGIAAFERDMAPAAAAFARAELVIFAYPVYTFLVPSQLHRFVELMKEHKLAVKNQFVTQLSTSMHFYDMTAHRFLDENFRDMGMRPIKGLSAGMEDLLGEHGRRELEDFLEYAVFCAENGIWDKDIPARAAVEPPVYECSLEPCKKQEGFDTVIVGDLREGDESLRALIKDFGAAYPYKTRFVNLADFAFKGGCLGCLNCAMSGSCVYKDGFETLLRDSIQSADAIVYAFTLRDHSMGARFKMFDDRQFCNGHRTTAEGKPFAYICLGDCAQEENLMTVLRARADVGHSFLAGVASDAESIRDVTARLAWALEHKYNPPRSFYGVGGMKIFRDLIWVMRGMMREDHRFYRKHGLYDFPQRRWPRMLGMGLLGAVMRSKRLRRLVGGRMNEGMLAPYKKVLDEM